MNILVTNDDGVASPGLLELISALQTLGKVTAVAPDRERSAIGHGVTFFESLRVNKLRDEKRCALYSASGTPTDCIMLGLCCFLKGKPDLIVCGINLGPNIGDDVTYSGTVSSAMEGALRGIPSMAVSLATFAEPVFSTAAAIAAKIAPVLLEKGIPARTFLNVNVPNVSLPEIRGIEITSQGESIYLQKFIRRKDPRGRDYYWLDHSRPQGRMIKGTDFYALSRNCVSVTPLHLDLTDHKFTGRMKKWNLSGILKPE